MSVDYNQTVKDVTAVFSGITNDGTTLKFKKGEIDYYEGGHLQGIQKKEGDYYLSGSSDDAAYLLIVDGQDFTASSQVDITPAEDSERTHAGGFQIIGDYLVVGLENDKEGGSTVALFSTDNASAELIRTLVSKEEGDEDGTGTAGAVGIVKLIDGHFLMIVGSWDCDKVNLYTATGELEDASCSFTLKGTWDKDTADKSGWIDDNWGEYQSLNLVQDENGSIYFFAFNRSGNRDFVDLYLVNTDNIENDTTKCFTKLARRHMYCHDGASFRYGSGIYIRDEGNISILASERDLHDETTINLF